MTKATVMEDSISQETQNKMGLPWVLAIKYQEVEEQKWQVLCEVLSPETSKTQRSGCLDTASFYLEFI